MPIRSDDLEHVLQRKFGFTPAVTRSSDHRWYEIHLPGLPAIVTKISHGKREEISGTLEKKIAHQLRVQVPYLRRMVGCTRSREEYYEKVRTDPIPPFDKGF